MGNIEDDFLADAEDDRLTVEFIKNYLPQEVKDKFTEDDLYYFLDVIGEYYVDLLEKTDNDDELTTLQRILPKKPRRRRLATSTPKTSVGWLTANWNTASL